MSWWADLKARFWRFLDKDETPYVEKPGIGVAWLWMLPTTHPFNAAALAHDADYDAMEAGTTTESTSGPADWRFYTACVKAAADVSKDAFELESYLWEAKLFYGIVTTWGRFRWRAPDKAGVVTSIARSSPWKLEAPNRLARFAPGPKKLVGLRPELEAIAIKVWDDLAASQSTGSQRAG